MLEKQSPTLKKLDLSGNLIEESLVLSIANESNLKLTHLSLLNLKSPQRFIYHKFIPLLGEKLAPLDTALRIRLSYYQVSMVHGDTKETGE